MDLVCMHHDSLVSIKQQPYEHVKLCCPDMESLPVEKCKCKPTDNILKSQLWVMKASVGYYGFPVGVSTSYVTTVVAKCISRELLQQIRISTFQNFVYTLKSYASTQWVLCMVSSASLFVHGKVAAPPTHAGVKVEQYSGIPAPALGPSLRLYSYYVVQLLCCTVIT